MARLLDPRNGSAFDRSPHTNTRTYVIASTPRSGSTLLARMLWDHGGAGAPKEYLNPMQIRDWEVRFGRLLSRHTHGLLVGPAVGLAGRRWTTERIDAHLRRVRERRSDDWFGLKLHWHHHQQFFIDRPLEDVLGPITWIRLRRLDPLAAAVSWDLALQTGRWISEQKAWRLPLYQRDRITARLADLDAANAGWDALLSGQPSIQLTYEELAENPETTVRRVLDRLNISPRPMPSPSLRRMGDPHQLEWIQAYREG